MHGFGSPILPLCKMLSRGSRLHYNCLLAIALGNFWEIRLLCEIET